MKKIILGIFATSIMICLSGCCLSHQWQEATCVNPKTCIKCGETEGEALGHIWQEATCTTPEACEICGGTQGRPLGHKWLGATCTAPEICTVCGATGKNALGHTWQEADCTTPKSCIVCKVTEGAALGHNLAAGGFCRNCDAELGTAITGDNLKNYFTVTTTGYAHSPCTISITPTQKGLTYGKKHNDKLYIQIKLHYNYKATQKSTGKTEIISIELDKNGYGSSSISFSDTLYYLTWENKDIWSNVYCY